MSNIFENAYKELKEKITSNVYKPSQRLVENQLTEELNVSRNTVREILYRLEQDKLIVIERNKGAYIKSLELEEVIEILEIRELLEILIAKAAVDNMKESDFERLENVILDMELSIKNEKYDEYSNNNQLFHRIIYEVSKKKEAVALVKTFKTQLIRHQFRTVLVSDRKIKSLEEHKSILRALKNYNKDEVADAVGKHIRNVAETIKLYYKYLQ